MVGWFAMQRASVLEQVYYDGNQLIDGLLILVTAYEAETEVWTDGIFYI